MKGLGAKKNRALELVRMPYFFMESMLLARSVALKMTWP